MTPPRSEVSSLSDEATAGAIDAGAPYGTILASLFPADDLRRFDVFAVAEPGMSTRH